MDKEVLGHRIRKAREQKGLSQEDFALLISRDQRAVSEYENGKRGIVVTDLPTFADALDVPLLYFYQGEQILDDLDTLMMEQLNRLSNQSSKKFAVDLVKLFCDALENTPSTDDF